MNGPNLPSIDSPLADNLAVILRALGHSQRLRIVGELCGEKELSVGDISQRMGMTQAATSQQLGILRAAGLVKYRIHQGFRLYSNAAPEVAGLISCLVSCATSHHPELRVEIAVNSESMP